MTSDAATGSAAELVSMLARQARPGYSQEFLRRHLVRYEPRTVRFCVPGDWLYLRQQELMTEKIASHAGEMIALIPVEGRVTRVSSEVNAFARVIDFIVEYDAPTVVHEIRRPTLVRWER